MDSIENDLAAMHIRRTSSKIGKKNLIRQKDVRQECGLSWYM